MKQIDSYEVTFVVKGLDEFKASLELASIKVKEAIELINGLHDIDLSIEIGGEDDQED